MSRELGELGGGPAGIAVGAQYRGDELSYDYDEDANRDNYLFLVGNPDFGDERDIDAVFVEFALPFTRNAEPAARGPLRGLRRRRRLDGPESELAVAAVAGVLAAHFRRHGVPRAVAVPGVRHADDARRAHRSQRRHAAVLPRPHAAESRAASRSSPEEADVFNVGVSFSPTEAWEIGIDYWSFDYTNVIIEQNAQALLNAAAQGNAQAQAQVIRDPASGLLLRVDSFYANASALETDGFDLAVSRALELRGGGSLRVGADATFIASYDLADPQAGRHRRRRAAQLRELRHVDAGVEGQHVRAVADRAPRRQRLRPLHRLVRRRRGRHRPGQRVLSAHRQPGHGRRAVRA